MVSEPRKQSMAWMVYDCSKHMHFRWKVKWWLEHLGALGIMDKTRWLNHVIGLSDLIDLWVVKIKTLLTIAYVVRRDQVNRARNADQAAKAFERSMIIKHGRHIHEVHKGLRAFFLIVLFEC